MFDEAAAEEPGNEEPVNSPSAARTVKP